ncbi:MAG: type II toxin-antitoxin system Phd/YefM family antitoxin [Deltaproteobacteria bacterium]|nr:type II toxin-antitoxin system Phd/YefM family antitoxin [Deltaproteobacteria bacterium]
MEYTDNIEPVTVLKTRSADLIKRVRETGRPVIITQNGKPTAVIVDMESYEEQRQTTLLLKALVQGDLDHREGRSLSHSQAKSRLKNHLNRLK